MTKRLTCLALVLALIPACAAGTGRQEDSGGTGIRSEYLVIDEEQKVFREGETEPFPEDAELMTLRVAPLLGADCMLLTLGPHSMLVDTGRQVHADTVMEMLEKAGLDGAEYVFSTHPHADHLGGMIPLLKRGLGVGIFFTLFPHNYAENDSQYRIQAATIQAMEEEGVPVKNLKTGDTIPFGDAEVTVLRIPDSEIEGHERSCNEMSGMLMVKYGDCSVLLTADVEPMNQTLLASLHDLKADILKYPHHGISLMPPEFLQEVHPEMVFFTHGAGNTHEAQKYIWSYGVTRMYFATWGTITMRTDGNKWIVTQEILPEYVRIAEKYTYGK